ncbi:DUF1330 domain-containing protein [Micromonospora sp. NPDC050784]|uniref:DUF1330 domain-containing protein n=1 Tax=Micromonospora sp. NPDC050784 TaxID=3364281 RepID=UPI0037AA9697
MSAYMIISVTPEDAERMTAYEAQTLEVVARFGGRPVARDTNPLVLESDHKPAIAVVLEFPDKQAILDFYHSPEYAPLKEFRHTFARASALVMDADIA